MEKRLNRFSRSGRRLRRMKAKQVLLGRGIAAADGTRRWRGLLRRTRVVIRWAAGRLNDVWKALIGKNYSTAVTEGELIVEREMRRQVMHAKISRHVPFLL